VPVPGHEFVKAPALPQNAFAVRVQPGASLPAAEAVPRKCALPAHALAGLVYRMVLHIDAVPAAAVPSVIDSLQLPTRARPGYNRLRAVQLEAGELPMPDQWVLSSGCLLAILSSEAHLLAVPGSARYVTEIVLPDWTL
jgi:hypothetical protein